MRVTIVEPVARGGMIHYAFQLARGLALTGARVCLVTDRHYELGALDAPFEIATPLRLWDPKPVTEPPPAVRALRRVLRGWRYYANWLRLLAFLRKQQPDFVLFGDIRFPADGLMLAAVRRGGLRMLDICHNIQPFKLHGPQGGRFHGGRLRRVFYRLAYRQFERVYVHFESNRRRFLETFSLPPDRVGVIPHGNETIFTELRDPRLTVAGLRKRLGLQTDDPIVLLFGGLSRYKGSDVLIEAFARVCACEPRSRLLLAGPPLPDCRPESLRDQARQLGCEDRLVVWPEYIPAGEVATWMELAALAVFPYREVFQSGALAVAQTFGVPSIVTSVGAMTEATDGDRCALVVPPEEPAALADAVLRLLTDRALAARLGDNARQRALTHGDWHRVGRVVYADLQQLQRSGPPGRAPLEGQEVTR